MYYILPFFLFVSVVITNFFYSVSSSCIDSAIDSISKNTFMQSLTLKVPESEVDDVDDFIIDNAKFEELYIEQFKNNLDYYQGEIDLSFAYYNVKTQDECNQVFIVCNGVQVRISVKPFSIIPVKDKFIRYEVKQINLE